MKSIHDWFKKKKEEKALEYKAEKLDIPGDLWIKCYKCGNAIYNKDLMANLKVCTKCGYHFKLTFAERLATLVDPDTFQEFDAEVRSRDFLDFVDTKPYAERLQSSAEKSGLTEAIITGLAKIGGFDVSIGIMDFSFLGGSMGSVVGERVTRMLERAIEKNFPAIIICSSGGARMQEGIMSLMQMAKTSAALSMLKSARLPYIAVLTDPTTGGTTASFAMLGDVNIAEKGALIGFAGPRVIEQTIRQKLPPGFQRAEYLEEHGMVDVVIERQELKDTLVKMLNFFKD
jgi:acetyl-CoA carboxylase carboxyl transferase subunit beta